MAVKRFLLQKNDCAFWAQAILWGSNALCCRKHNWWGEKGNCGKPNRAIWQTKDQSLPRESCSQPLLNTRSCPRPNIFRSEPPLDSPGARPPLYFNWCNAGLLSIFNSEQFESLLACTMPFKSIHRQCLIACILNTKWLVWTRGTEQKTRNCTRFPRWRITETHFAVCLGFDLPENSNRRA